MNDKGFTNSHMANQYDQEIAALRQRIQELEALEIDHQNAQEELRQTGLKYYNLFESAGEAIFIVETESLQILDANAAATRRFGFTVDEFRQQTLTDLEVLNDHNAGSNAAVWESTFGGTQFYECHIRHKTGAKIPVEVSSRLVTFGNGDVFLNFVRDVSKRKAAEYAIQQAHDRLLVLRDVDAELTKELDVNYVLNMALNAAVNLSNAGSGAIGIYEGNRVRIVHGTGEYTNIIGSELPIDSSIAGRVVRNQVAEFVPDISHDPDYLELIPDTRSQISLPLISHDRLLGIMSVETPHPDHFSDDIFEFLKLLATRIAVALDNAYAYEGQEHLIEDLDAFAHTVAHDLKNPLNIIGGYASVLNSQFQSMSPEDLKDYLGAIAQSTTKMSNIINELLLLSSVRQIDDIEQTPLFMYRIISEALTRLTLLIEGHHAEIVLPDADAFPTAYGYAPWIEEIWSNYLSNAIKYGGEPARIEVGADELPNNKIRFWVRDNGKGIAAEDQAKLFSEHTQLDGSSAGGHGLGLSIVKRIINKLGGEVGVESTLGTGSTFYFTLPAAE